MPYLKSQLLGRPKVASEEPHSSEVLILTKWGVACLPTHHPHWSKFTRAWKHLGFPKV